MSFDISTLLHDWDPVLRVLGALAAPGGLWFWIDKYRSRIHLKVRRAGFTKGDTSGRAITLVVENIGSSATSTGLNIFATGFDAKRKRFRLHYRLHGEHARLQPLDAVELTAWHNDPENRTLLWAWYFVIVVPMSRGGKLKVRYRNAEFQRLGFWRFHWERLLFRLFRRTPSAA